MMLFGGVKVLRVSGPPLFFVLLWMVHSVVGLGRVKKKNESYFYNLLF